MAIIKCKMCGGDIVLAEDKTYGTCEYCGSTMTFPKVSDEQRLNLFNRANHFRRLNEFDKAIAAYDKILDLDDTDAEAHWGAVLSRYGIEYVEDPVIHERIPTCHRVQLGSILTDADYLAALEHAPDTASRDIYEAEAKRIADIQKGILAISAQEKPYDVFICYKETDDNGSRTKDSTLAQDIYYQLTNEGYKVFFSRITLEDKLGREYEPYIFAALNSAKVMLVIGTKSEHFNAVWVKNEWSRYLDLMKRDRNKLLIPCYRDMDPYDLPEELSALQSQDMSKIGFMQDIIHGVKKVLNTGKEQKPVVIASTAGPGIASLHKRAVLFLEDGDWGSASEYFDRILDIDPEYAPAYIGKVQVTNKVRKEEGLAKCVQPLKGNSDYKKALRFANEQQKAIYEGYNRAIEDRLELERKETIYREADALEKRAATEAEFLATAKKYDEAGEIRDAKERASNCRAKAASAKQAAERQAEEYRKQLEREREERKRKEEEARIESERRAEQQRIEAEKRAEQERYEAEKRRKRNRIIAVAVAAILVVTGGVFVINSKVIQPRNRYNAAQVLLEEGKYDEAVEAFGAMESYSNSAEKVKEAYYAKATAFLDNGKLTMARDCFKLAGDYSDAVQQVKKIEDYSAAEAYYNEGEYLSARPIYASLGDYRDSTSKLDDINKTLYAKAGEKMQSGDATGAYETYIAISDYPDSAQIIAKADKDYQTAIGLWEKGDKTGAEMALAALAGWSDADAKLEALREEIADDAADAEDYQKALTYYAKLKDQTEAVTAKITNVTKAKVYQEAETALGYSSFKTAYAKFVEAGDYSDATDRAAKLDKYIKANEAMTTGSYVDARVAYLELGDYLDSQKQVETCNKALYDSATTQMENGDVAGAYETFTLISGYEDSAEITAKVDSDYQAALDFWAKGDKTGAEAALVTLSGWNDVDAKLDNLWEEIADDAAKAGNYVTALTYYGKITHRTEELEAKVTAATQAKAYGDAEDALSSGDYETAYAQFVLAAEHKDASEQAAKLDKYIMANGDMESGQYMKARTAYMELGDYLESSKNLETCNAALYKEASALMLNGDVAEAYVAFTHISDYSDSAAIVEEIKVDYDAATKLLEKGKFDEANAAFIALNNYSDSEIQALESLYQKATALAAEGKYVEAASLYTELGDYSDSVAKANEVRYNNANNLWKSGDLQAAAKEYEMLGEYADAPQLFVQINTEIADKALADKDYAVALVAYRYLEQTDEVKAKEYELAQACYEEKYFAEATAAYEMLGQYELSLSKLPIARYAWADQLFSEGDYAKAAEQFALLGEMIDSADRTKESIYQLAKQELETGDYTAAKATFQSIKDYSDADTMVKECDYRVADALLVDEKYEEAQGVFEALGTYSDSATKAKQCVYNQAEVLFATGDYSDSEELYASIDYEDSAEKAKLSTYKQAEALFAVNDYAGAESLYDSISEYKDSSTKAKECSLQQGIDLMKCGKYKEALAFLDGLGFADSANRAAQCHYFIGHNIQLQEDMSNAVKEYAYALDIPEARISLMDIAKGYAASNQTIDAIQVLWLIRNDNAANALLGEIADLEYQQGELGLSLLAYTILEETESKSYDMSVSSIEYKEMVDVLNNCDLLPDSLEFGKWIQYYYALAAINSEEFELAAEIFGDLGTYNNAVSMSQESIYLQAGKLLKDGETVKSLCLYDSLRGYKDVDEILCNDRTIKKLLSQLKQFDIGEKITMGKYGTEKMYWYVIAKDGYDILLLSRWAVTAMKFGPTPWKNSDVRSFLNGPFYDSAFSEKEKEKIIQNKEVKSQDTEEVRRYKERFTQNEEAKSQDTVFLLSSEEARRYDVEKYVCYAGSEATQKGVREGLADWWGHTYPWWGLRTTDGEGNWQYGCREKLYDEGKGASPREILGVRPAIWINSLLYLENIPYESEETEEKKEPLQEGETEKQNVEKTAEEYEQLSIGSKDDSVLRLQQVLIDQGYLLGTADGDYGNKTAEAVKKAQKVFGMDQTGVADEAFQKKLFGLSE